MKRLLYIAICLLNLVAFGQGGITTATGFSLRDPQPIDDKLIHNGSTGRAAIHDQFNGLFSSDISDAANPKLYIKGSGGWIQVGGGIQTLTGFGVDNSNPVNPVVKEVKGLPSDLWIAGSLQGFNSLGYSLRYFTDTFRSVDLKPFIPTLTNSITEIMRDGNDLILIANNGSATTSSNPIMIIRLYECRIVDNVLTWQDLKYSNITVETRVHGITLHRGYVYLATRPSNAAGATTQITKINARNFTDIKQLMLPAAAGTFTDIIGYKDGIYANAIVLTTGQNNTFNFIKIDENLNGYTSVFTFQYGAGLNEYRAGQSRIPFVIYNDEIYICYATFSSIPNNRNFVSLFVYNFKGEIVRNSLPVNINPENRTLANGYISHWITVQNGKVIVSPSDITVTTNGYWKLLRFDCNSMLLEEQYQLSSSPTDDNTQFSTGEIWLNGEGTNYNLTYLMKVMYNDFAGTYQNALNPYGSTGSINTAHLVQKERLKTKLSDFINDLGSGGSVTSVTGVSNEITVANGTTTPVIGISPAYTTARNAYADSKVQNNLSASTTIAPSATAVNTALDTKVSLTGAQTVGGVKTFSSPPSVPTGTLGAGGTNAASQAYADTAAATQSIQSTSNVGATTTNTLTVYSTSNANIKSTIAPAIVTASLTDNRAAALNAGTGLELSNTGNFKAILTNAGATANYTYTWPTGAGGTPVLSLGTVSANVNTGAIPIDTTPTAGSVNTVTSNGVAAALSLYPKIIIEDVTDSATMSGASTELTLKSYLIPANTINANGVLSLSSLFSHTGVAGTKMIRVYKNTTNSTSGATLIAYVNNIASILSNGFYRDYKLVSSTLTYWNSNGNNASQQTSASTQLQTTTFDPTVDNYIITTTQLGSAADSTTQKFFEILYKKAQ